MQTVVAYQAYYAERKWATVRKHCKDDKYYYLRNTFTTTKLITLIMLMRMAIALVCFASMRRYVKYTHIFQMYLGYGQLTYKIDDNFFIQNSIFESCY